MATLCSNCGGALVYSPTSHKMSCKMCGSTFKPEEVVALGKELLVEDNGKTLAEVHGTRNPKDYKVHIYTCSHCGGDVVVNGSEASTVCVYCGNPTVVFSRVANERRPDGIVPFSIGKEEAEKLIRSHLNRGAFIPNKIKKQSLDNIRGIYVPYWIVNCDFYDSVVIKGDVKSGKHTRTTYFARAGRSRFELLPCDASLNLNDNMAKRLEPYYYDDVKDFDEDYLGGFYSDTSDMSPSDLRAAVLRRCDDMFCEEAIKNIRAQNLAVEKTRPYVNIDEDAIYLMLPVWFYTFMYNGKPNTVLVNGQTGKTVGTLPINKGKLAALTIPLFLLLAAIVLYPVIRLSLEDIVAYFPIMVSFSTVFGVSMYTIAGRKIRRIINNIKDSQSSSTFLYVRKRQG